MELQKLFEQIYNNTSHFYEGNPIGKDAQGNAIFEYQSVSNLPNDLFESPTFSVLLPSPSKILLKEVGKQENKVLLKKSSIERMLKEHKEIKDAKEHKAILQNAIYEATTVLICQKNKKPDYISFIRILDYYYVSVLDFNSNNKYIEVVDWRKIGDEGFLGMIKQASVGAG